ncbi:MAG: NAD(P)/FAD-dependent oxidoreductase [Acetobacterales bacterium]
MAETAHDLVIVGAGPAGLSAAVAAAGYGLDVLLIDEQQAPGGQIWRGVERVAAERPGDLDLFGADYAAGRELVRRFRASGASYMPGATVWQITPDRRLAVTDAAGTRLVAAQEILLASGAYERPVPIPGWTLPGVLTAGAAQVLVKQAGALPDGQIVLAGNGPLLLLVASQLLAAGVPVSALLETAPTGRVWSALPLLPKAVLRSRPYLEKGLGMLAAIRRAGVARFHGVTALEAVPGDDGRLGAVRFAHHGRTEELKADLLLLHEGVIPNVQLSMAAGCAHRWDPDQLCWRPVFDDWGATDRPGIAVAGDGAWIGGARLAETSGHIAVLGALARLGRIDEAERDRRARPLRRAALRDTAIRPLLDALYRPPAWALAPMRDDVVICRCEDVTAGAVRVAVREGCHDAPQVKAFTRCGMGPCQGRMCAPTLCRLIAAERGVELAAVPPPPPRFPVKPVRLGDIAALSGQGDGPGAPDWM